MSIEGAIVESNQMKLSFKVKNFKDVDTEKPIKFGDFHFADGEWSIKIFPKESENYVGIYLYKTIDKPTNVNYKLSIICSDGKVIKSFESKNKTFESKLGWGLEKFISRNDLFEAITPDFTFAVVCELTLNENLKFEPSPNFISTSISDAFNRICSASFHDLKIVVQDREIAAHRNIISAVLFNEILKLGDQDPLKIEDFSFEIVQEVVNIIYGKDVKNTDKDVKKILLAAIQYQIEGLQADCEKNLFEKMTIENAIETLIFVDDNKLGHLLIDFIYFVEMNIDALIKMQDKWEEFFLGHPHTFRKLFQSVLKSSLKQSSDDHKTTSSDLVADGNVVEIEKMSVTLDDFEYLYKTMGFADIIFNIGEKTLKAHKCFLISRSTVFRAMFEHDFLESKENRVEITDIDYGTMQQLLQYIYRVKVTGLKDNAMKLFSAADKYNLMELKDLCKISMERNITVDNITEILKLVDLHSSYLTDLKELATKFFEKNFAIIFESTGWNDFANSNSRILNEMLIKFLKTKK